MEHPEKRPRGRPRLSDTSKDAASIQSLDRAIALLAAVSEASGMTLMQVSAATQLPPSTAYRMLTTLQHHGMVEFEEAGQLWHVGVSAFRIGSSFLRRRKITDRSRLVMQDLAQRFEETANLAVAEDDVVVFVSQVETHAPLRAFFRPGTSGPYHASGVGKAILAFLAPDRVRRTLARVGQAPFTLRTITDVAALETNLQAVRARGWAIDDEERYLGMRCVAAPIFNEFGEPIAGLSLSGPSLRLTDEVLPVLGPAIRAAAGTITLSIAGRPPA
ncbi:MAG TPA: IclR family transcriptional regulator [Azospirillum sp.]|nr:IclR family transcriptional regulator [Azospirillum sp.]